MQLTSIKVAIAANVIEQHIGAVQPEVQHVDIRSRWSYIYQNL